MIIAATITLFIGLIAGYEVLRSLPLIPGLVVMGIVPFVMFFVWKNTAKKCGWNWFHWAKTYSVISLSCILMIGNSTELQVVTGWIIYGFIVVNILEASVCAFQKGIKYNGIAGILVALTTPLGSGVYVLEGSYDILYTTPILWIAAYTIWNFTFVYTVFTRVYCQHIAVLLAPFVLSLIYGADIWIQARVFTLAFFLLMYNTAFPWFYLRFTTEKWQSEKIGGMLIILSLASVLTYIGTIIVFQYYGIVLDCSKTIF